MSLVSRVPLFRVPISLLVYKMKRMLIMTRNIYIEYLAQQLIYNRQLLCGRFCCYCDYDHFQLPAEHQYLDVPKVLRLNMSKTKFMIHTPKCVSSAAFCFCLIILSHPATQATILDVSPSPQPIPLPPSFSFFPHSHYLTSSPSFSSSSLVISPNHSTSQRCLEFISLYCISPRSYYFLPRQLQTYNLCLFPYFYLTSNHLLHCIPQLKSGHDTLFSKALW